MVRQDLDCDWLNSELATMTDKTQGSHAPLLGQHTEYVSIYTPSLLCSIPRCESREGLGITKNGVLPFQGVDVWTAYEVSWLDAKGKPAVSMATFQFPASSTYIVESKSFKLYLNSFNQTRFNDLLEVIKTLESDLSSAAGSPVMVTMNSLSQAASDGVGHFTGECVDDEDVIIDCYHPNAALLALDEHKVELHEVLYSDLLKSNCPVTGQPDWASVWVEYHGTKINRAALLQYIVSFREHQDFHENCVERMFMDIMKQCQPRSLTVYARYTRRGGLDINPYRSSTPGLPEVVRLVRQ